MFPRAQLTRSILKIVNVKTVKLFTVKFHLHNLLQRTHLCNCQLAKVL